MRTDRRPALGRWALRSVVIVYVVLLVAWPTGLVFKRAFQDGVDTFFSSLSSPDVQHALALTVTVAGWAVVINLVFGVAISLLLVRYRFPGRRILSVLIDVPLSVSPVVVGLALVLVYNARDGWFGTTLAEWGFQVIFSTPGMIMATVFVALPLVVREVTPVLEEIGTDQEQAARSLGAGGFQTFWRITLPGIRWAIVYGLVLAVARSIGEFGAVKIVSGNITGQSQTATLAVEQTYQNFDHQAAYAIAALLAFTAMLCLVVVAILRPKEQH
jgi:sulfate transport system permease protein